MDFHLSYNDRNAKALLIPSRPRPKTTVRVSPRRQEVSTVRVETGLRRLEPVPETIEKLRESDDEVDLNVIGRPLEDVTRAYFNPETREIARSFEITLIQYDAEGNEKERKPFERRKPNVDDEVYPVKIGKFVPRAKFFEHFVVERAYQLGHDDTLKYEFLYELAAKLEKDECVALLGAGPKGQGPLVFKDNGRPFRCALTGRTEGERYELLVLLLGQELKLPEGREEETA